jgi:GDPmannose 4,6-dehydratase
MKYLIFGITGQDGGYLASMLVKKGYDVIGVRRPASTDTTQKIKEIFIDEGADFNKLQIIHGDLIDYGSVINIINNYKPYAVINLAAQSHVGISFDLPELTANIDGLGSLRILEAIRHYSPKTRYYQASTSELYGGITNESLNEETPFNPLSPYSVAKLYSFWITRLYRTAYGINASNGILFNHESPFRGEHFVTQKIIKGLVAINKNEQGILRLGTLYSKRDWGHARDYMEALYAIVNSDKPDDYVVATGKTFSIKEFIDLVLHKLEISGEWMIEDNELESFVVKEAKNKSLNSKKIITQDRKYMRPADVEHLLGDPSKIYKNLGWKHKSTISDLVDEMVEKELS